MRNWNGLTLLAFVLPLAGCGGAEPDKAKGAGTAVGEVLPGSASDAMIPVDQVKSQSPLAPRTDSADKPDVKATNKAKLAAPRDAPADAAPAEQADEPVAEE